MDDLHQVLYADMDVAESNSLSYDEAWSLAITLHEYEQAMHFCIYFFRFLHLYLSPFFNK